MGKEPQEPVRGRAEGSGIRVGPGNGRHCQLRGAFTETALHIPQAAGEPLVEELANW